MAHLLVVMFMDLNHFAALNRTSVESITASKKSGGYRSRTDDPLRARQML